MFKVLAHLTFWFIENQIIKSREESKKKGDPKNTRDKENWERRKQKSHGNYAENHHFQSWNIL